MNVQLATAALQKSLGAFYTGEPTADRLVSWAITDGSQAVLDPCCGDRVFLSAASSCLRFLGSEMPTICGIDVSRDALKLAGERVAGAKLAHSDLRYAYPDSSGRNHRKGWQVPPGVLETKFDASTRCSWEPRLHANDEDADM